MIQVSREVLDQTFAHFRRCGAGRRECQALWVGPWQDVNTISHAIHPKHNAHVGGFVLDDGWLNEFWVELAKQRCGVRIQVHTHPREAFHSPVDDAYPIVHSAGFLSLVIPDFALGPVGFERAYLAEIGNDGRWREVPVAQRIVLT